MISFSKIHEWLNKEKKLGSLEPEYVVLATASKEGIPSTRVVYIREINEKGILFFTQQETRKVIDLSDNPCASMTLWLPMQQREVVLDGYAEKLTFDEKKCYWESMHRERQLRFIVNSLRIKKSKISLDDLNKEYDFLLNKFHGEEIPMSDFYCGFCFVPKTIYFYTLVSDGFSEIEFCP